MALTIGDCAAGGYDAATIVEIDGQNKETQHECASHGGPARSSQPPCGEFGAFDQPGCT